MKSVPALSASLPSFGDNNTQSKPPRVPGCSYDEISAWQLGALCTALGLEHTTKQTLELQRCLFEPWGAEQVPASPQYPSGIGDDHSPYEYSLAFAGDSVELRILFETQAQQGTAKAVQAAAQQTNTRLRRQFGLDFGRFNAIADLFLPEDPSSSFSLWHAVCLNEGQPPAFKLYLNPKARGSASAQALVLEAMTRLGMSAPARQLFNSVATRGSLDEVRYFSLDLSQSANARVKVYFAHQGVTAKDLEKSFAYAPGHKKGDVETYLRTIAGHTGPFNRKPITSCFSFVANRSEPLAATLHYPIAHYEENDEQVVRRVTSYLSAHGMQADVYRRAVMALARRRLDDGIGLQSYASYRREANGLRFTTYLSPELFSSAARSGIDRVA